ncbi:MAG: complex I NDUFA9 subunit family protein, partial [Gammaproteobacteria bacterium]|nr:complex I NDUFA9 subunit family protein [Gammaproteobacteria bacterium]
TRKVVSACRKAGVNRLLHMSALNADAASGPSIYLRTKGEAEGLVLTQGGGEIDATIFQPSVIFGPEDSFVNRFAALLNLMPLVFPLACPNARFAPVYVGDVAEAFIRSIDRRDTFGKRYQLCGPEAFTLKELVAYIADLLGKRRLIIGLPAFFSKLQALAMEFVPGKPFSLDNYHSLSVDSVCGENGFAAFNITPTDMDAVVPGYIAEDNMRGRYAVLRRASGR